MGGDGDGIELDLGLSIGRSFGKKEESNPTEKALVFTPPELDWQSNNLDADTKENVQSFVKPDVSAAFGRENKQEIWCLNPQKKREIQALRRQEAKKKMEEKQQRKGMNRARNGKNINGGIMVPDREITKETEFIAEEPACKREKVEELNGSAHENSTRKGINLNLSNEYTVNQNGAYNVMQQQCPSPSLSLQYVGVPNGFACGPYVMPVWASESGGGGNDRNVVHVHPMEGRNIKPFRDEWSSGNRCNSEQNNSKEGGNGNAGSNGSPLRSSPVLSDYQSSSYQGGSSIDSGSHSSHFLPESQLNGSTASHSGERHEQNTSSDLASYPQMTHKARFDLKKAVSSNVSGCKVVMQEESKAKSNDQIDASKRTVSTTENPNNDPSKDVSGDIIKPPTQNHGSTLSFPQMPYVSTTGNGPNGKTISGFLYRYTRTEISIICVCHGSSFSPSEFVEHAGGTDVKHPLKHITVIPSAFS